MSMMQMLLGAGGSAADPTYVESYFAQDIYTPVSGSENYPFVMTNGLDLAGEGGMVWCKRRDADNYNHVFYDTVRGVNKKLQCPAKTAQITTGTDGSNGASSIYEFTSTGWKAQQDNASGETSYGNWDYVTYGFRKAKGFFDVVKYEGTGSAQSIAHSLGCKPGMMIITAIDVNNFHTVTWHKGQDNSSQDFNNLNEANAHESATNVWNDTDPTSTHFTVGSNSETNYDSSDFIAYLFADGDESDAQIFGDDGDEKIIKCGTYDGTGSDQEIDVGFEPQWILIKNIDVSSSWYIFDIARGVSFGDWPDEILMTNSNSGDVTTNGGNYADGAIGFLPNGFMVTDAFGDLNSSGATMIYMAIRRPMKPADHDDYTKEKLFDPYTYTSNESSLDVPTSIDRFYEGGMVWMQGDLGQSSAIVDNTATGYYSKLRSNASDDREESSPQLYFDNPGFQFTGNGDNANNSSGNMFCSWSFKRAPKFFDIACFRTTTTNNTITIPHNLGVVPELIIVKCLTADVEWQIYHASVGNTKYGKLNANTEWVASSARWNNTTPTATHFTISTEFTERTEHWVAYLWASLDGISKVGHYTGNGGSPAQDIDCGFSSAARFVMIKNSETASDWQLYDSARGFGTGTTNGLYYVNHTGPFEDIAAADSIATYSSGFTVSSGATRTAINQDTKKIIYLAIA